MDILWRLSLWLLVPLINAYADRKGAKRHYYIIFILRAGAAILHGILFINDYRNYWFYWWPVLLFQVTSFWIVFELILNLWWNKYHPKDKRELLYYDRKEKDSGWIDRFFAWTGPAMHTTAKILALAIMIFSIILIYKRGIQL